MGNESALQRSFIFIVLKAFPYLSRLFVQKFEYQQRENFMLLNHLKLINLLNSFPWAHAQISQTVLSRKLSPVNMKLRKSLHADSNLIFWIFQISFDLTRTIWRKWKETFKLFLSPMLDFSVTFFKEITAKYFFLLNRPESFPSL